MKRADGITVVIIGLLYGWAGLGIVSSRVGIQDRVGPGFFPAGVALLIILCGAVMLIRKDGVDHQRVWPLRKFWKALVLLVGVLVVYGLVFDWVGFLITNTILCVYIGVLLKARLLSALISGTVISLSIMIVFNFILEINLPSGALTFVETWFYN